MTTLEQIGEFALIERLLNKLDERESLALLGLGDDCATIPQSGGFLLLSTDTLVAGVHFDLRFFPPEAVGYRALAVNISDIAAMGGTPLYALVSLQAPVETPVALLEDVYVGLNRCARRYQVKVVGGNVTFSREFSIGITIVGDVRGNPVRRSGAQIGDSVWVSGNLGGASAALRMLQGGSAEVEAIHKDRWLERLFSPEPRLGLGRALQLNSLASSMIDVSDGVVQDLGHIAAASAVSIELVVDAVPVELGLESAFTKDHAVINSGDDYELLFTVPRDRDADLSKIQGIDCPITRIGAVVQEGTGNLEYLAKQLSGSYQHFVR
jgi:thiamine-monophosphate kinase